MNMFNIRTPDKWDLCKFIVSIGNRQVQWSQPVVLLTLITKKLKQVLKKNFDIDLDNVLDGAWEMPNEGSSNLCVD